MHIEFSTDNHIQGNEDLAARVRTTVEHAMAHVQSHVTRVEVHVSDAGGGKGGQTDLHCTMEARIEGQNPVIASEQAATLEQAVAGAAGKLKRVVQQLVERMQETR